MRNIFKKLSKYLSNYRQNETFELTLQEAKDKAKEANAILVDVRSMQEYEENHIPNAICLPYYEMQSKAEKVLNNKDKPIILYCQTGVRSKKAYQILSKLGYTNLYHIKNGISGN